jgi:hypothetical protein
MKPLYIIYEADLHESYDSMVIKFIGPQRIAKKLYDKSKKRYMNSGSDYQLIFGVYEPLECPEMDNNILKEISKIDSSDYE